MSASISTPKRQIEAFCRRNHIRRLALFGSVLRDDFGPDCDEDGLVEFEPNARVGLFELYDMERDFSGMLAGRNVEMSTPQSLSKYFRDAVLGEAEVFYAMP